MPEPDRSQTGHSRRPDGDRIGPKRTGPVEESSKGQADRFVAKWLDAAINAWGKALAYAEMIEVDHAHVTRMRAGEKAAPLRALLPFFGHAESTLTFVQPLLDSIGYVARPVAGPTFTQLAGAVLADLDDGSSVTRQLIQNAAAKRGWTPAQVQMALHKEDDK